MSGTNEQPKEGTGRARKPRASSASLGRYRIYSKQGEEKAYLRVEEGGTIRWVRSWREASAYHSPVDAKETLRQARALEPGRPMCVVVWGTRLASLATTGEAEERGA